MAGLILDSDALLGLINSTDVHHKSIVNRILQSDERLSISVVTLSEALVRPFEVGRSETAIGLINSRISQIIEVDQAIAVRAAGLQAKSKMKLPDALIAATAMEKGLTLLTFDEKLARRVPGAEWLGE
jgi:predicted nucleic acid-binding protein